MADGPVDKLAFPGETEALYTGRLDVFDFDFDGGFGNLMAYLRY